MGTCEETAENAYDDAEISGSTLTLTRGNGGTTQIEIPSGGGEWVKISDSLSNIDNTKIKIGTQLIGLVLGDTTANIRYFNLTCGDIEWDGIRFFGKCCFDNSNTVLEDLSYIQFVKTDTGYNILVKKLDETVISTITSTPIMLHIYIKY